MGTAEQRYETKTVKALRGNERRTVDKWRAEGWEAVSRSPGKMQTEITLRRPKRTVNPKLYVIGGVAAAMAIAIVVSVSALTHHSTPTAAETSATASETHQAGRTSPAAPAPSVGSPQASASAARGSADAQPRPSQTATKTLTAVNSPELAAILAERENCSATIEAFARKHAGETIAFDGNIASLQRHGDTATRYDILVGAGNHSTSTAVGPTFQFRDVNLTNDLHFTGANPEAIGVGDNVRVVARVDEYTSASCLFFIEPVTTTMR